MAGEPALYARMELRIRDFEKQLQKANAAADASMAKIGRSTQRTQKAVESRFEAIGASAARSLGGIGKAGLAGLVGALGAREVGQAAAAYTNLTNTLKVTGLEGKNLTGALQSLFSIAQANGTAIEPLVTLYSRLSQSQKELGASSEDLLKFTDGISVALRVGGTSAEQASGALLQLSQALGGAVVRAEEFNSINEGARPILQAVANGLEEAGGSVSKLRSLVVDGKLSSETFFRAFMAGMGGLQAQAAKAAGTVDQGMTRIGNALVLLVGHLDETAGASTTAATNLNSVASAIEGLPSYIDAALSGLAKLRSYLADFGNLPIWRRLGEAMGIDYSPEGLAELTGYNPNAGGKRAGSSRRGGATMARTGISTVSINDAPADGAGDKKSKAPSVNDFERMTQAIRDRTGAIEAETAAQAGLNPLVADYGFAVEKARAEYDLLQAAHEAGLTVTPELKQQIDNLATAYANASVTAAQLAESQGKFQQAAAEFNDIGKDVLGGFISDMRNGVSAADALTNALNKVLDKLLDIALNNLFSPGGGAGGLGGIIGQALGFAQGGYTGPGGKMEPAGVVHKGEYVFSKAATSKIGAGNLEALHRIGKGYASGGLVAPTLPTINPASRGSSGGGAVAPQINVEVNNLPGTTADVQQRPDGGVQIDIRRLVRDEVKNGFNDGSFDRVGKTRFGWRRQV
ncbi:tape measure protein [Ancylobacter moscoviensis]